VVVSLSRPGDGRVMCCICFSYRWPDELYTDAQGQKWDICGPGQEPDEDCAGQAGL
jgi:hypothetical protein